MWFLITAPPYDRPIITVDNDVTEVDEHTSHMVTCKTTGIYPRDKVRFSIVSGDTDVVTLRDATDTEELSGTFKEELFIFVEFIRDYNINPLQCKVAYEGPADDGSLDTTILSQNLEVTVRCKCVIIHMFMWSMFFEELFIKRIHIN